MLRRPCALLSVAVLAGVVAAGCADADEQAPHTAPSATPASPSAAPTSTPAPEEDPADAGGGAAGEQTGPASPRPSWLGTRVLPLRPDGLGEIQPTPPELEDRRLMTPDVLPPPDTDEFAATVEGVSDDVAQRSTWSPECPVSLNELRYVTVAFWGFDERPHTGELLVHASVADDLVSVFRRLHEVRFPIEEMRITTAEELDAPPTGDGNLTSAFVCRPSVSSSSWSQHAYGLAVDINSFHNPYRKGDVVVPELASAYLDREWHRPGMIQPGDAVTESFAAIGWGWGGNWSSAKDWMHFSRNGR